MFKSVLCLLISLLSFANLAMEAPRVLAMDLEELNQGLIRAVRNNNFQDARALLQLGADANTRERFQDRIAVPLRNVLPRSQWPLPPVVPLRFDGFTRRPEVAPITRSFRIGGFDWNLEVDPEPEYREETTWGSRALQLACNTGNAELCELLLAHHAHIANAEDYGNNSLLHQAARANNDALCRVLLRYGAHVDERAMVRGIHSFGEQASSPLYLAAGNGQTAVCRALVDGGADIHLQGGIFEDTPVHRAVAGGHRDTCKVLLKKGNIALLAGIRRLAREGSLAARSLYHERVGLLRPHLEIGLFEVIREETPEAQEEARNRERRNALIVQIQNNNNINNDNNAPQHAAQPQQAEIVDNIPEVQVDVPADALMAEAAPAHVDMPAVQANFYEPAEPVAAPEAAAAPFAGYPDAPRSDGNLSSSKNSWARGIVILAVAGIASAAIYKLYKWVKEKKAKPHTKKIIKKQAPQKKADFEDSDLQADIDWLFAQTSKR